mgnify:CR=1 FL=1
MQLKDVESRKKHKELREQRANNIKNHGLKVSDSELELILDVIHGETATISKDKVKSLSNELISTILDSKYAGDFKKSFDEIKERDDIWPNLLHRIELRINGHL